MVQTFLRPSKGSFSNFFVVTVAVDKLNFYIDYGKYSIIKYNFCIQKIDV